MRGTGTVEDAGLSTTRRPWEVVRTWSESTVEFQKEEPWTVGSSPGGAVGTREELPWNCERTGARDPGQEPGGLVPQGERLQKIKINKIENTQAVR